MRGCPPCLPDLALAAPYLRAIAASVAAAGADEQAWLARHGLAPDALSDTALELPLAGFAALIRDAIATTREPALGLLVGDRLGVDAHGALGTAALHGASLREVAQLLSARFDVRAPLVALDRAEVGAELRLVVRDALPPGEVRRALLEAVVVALRKLIDTAAQGVASVTRVEFDFREPPYAAFARGLLRGAVRWRRDWTGLVIPLASIDRPLRGADPLAYAVLARRVGDEALGAARERPVSAALRRLLLGCRGGMPALPAAARLLHRHPRTLHRCLVAEGCSYRALVDDVRRTLAREYLAEPGWTMADTAFALGYAEPASLRRALRRWRAASTTPASRRDLRR